MPRKKAMTAKPKRVKGKKMYKKRVYRKRGNFGKVTHLPFGQSQLVNHRYIETIQLSTTLGAPNLYTFQLNSLYDPNTTGGGHQPIGRDQMALVFNQYCVIGGRLQLKIWNRDVDEFLGVGVYLSESSTSPLGSLSIAGLLEQSAVSYRILPPGGATGPNPSVQTLSVRFSTKKVLKVKSLLDNNDVCSSSGTNPARGLYAHVFIWQPDSGGNSASMSFYATIDQTAVWFSPTNVPQS